MSQTMNVSIQMDEDLKREFEAFCVGVGMSMSTAVNVFARQTVRERRIPFVIGESAPNEQTLEALREVRRMKDDKSLGKTYDDVDAMMGELLGDV